MTNRVYEVRGEHGGDVACLALLVVECLLSLYELKPLSLSVKHEQSRLDPGPPLGGFAFLKILVAFLIQ